MTGLVLKEMARGLGVERALAEIGADALLRVPCPANGRCTEATASLVAEPQNLFVHTGARQSRPAPRLEAGDGRTVSHFEDGP